MTNILILFLTLPLILKITYKINISTDQAIFLLVSYQFIFSSTTNKKKNATFKI